MPRTKGYILKEELLKQRACECEQCHNTIWLNSPIPLEVHHIDGDNENNSLENLQLLCPNCHALTTTFSKKKKVSDEEIVKVLLESETIHQALIQLNLSTCGTQYDRIRKIINQNNITKFNKDFIENFCIDCGAIIMINSTRCVSCSNKKKEENSSINELTREQLKKLIKEESFVQIGKRFSVSDNAIRKWCDKFNLPRTKKEINSYSDEEWKLI